LTELILRESEEQRVILPFGILSEDDRVRELSGIFGRRKWGGM
jgi:hypothetical protein